MKIELPSVARTKLSCQTRVPARWLNSTSISAALIIVGAALTVHCGTSHRTEQPVSNAASALEQCSLSP